MQAIRIGNCQAFWGDRDNAAAEMLAQEPDLDYLTLDYLAEVSMSILAVQRARDPQAGFARDFVEVIRSLAPYWEAGGRCRVIANAGGLDPRGCAEACCQVLAGCGRTLRVGVVTGDDVLPQLRIAASEPSSRQFQNLDTGALISPVRDRLVTANAYLGAAPIVAALAAGADIVITGRVADPSLVVAPCMHHFGWSDDDWDQLAGATVAGHLIECGTQVTGGVSTDWLDVPDVAHIGFPIVEVSDDGSAIATKSRSAGGHVTCMTVKEQLVYELGDPENYLSPDVTVSFASLKVVNEGENRIRVSGATGRPGPSTYKVSATYRDGYRAAGMLTFIGREAVPKARRCGELVLQRVSESGFELRDSLIECLGSGDGAVGIGRLSNPRSDGFGETVLRVAVEAETRDAIVQFTRELMPFVTAGPQGTTGYAEGRPRVHEVYRYWPCLISRDELQTQLDVMTAGGKKANQAAHVSTRRTSVRDVRAPNISLRRNRASSNHHGPPCLFDIAAARSGDKGINANIGIIARRPVAWPFLQSWLSADRVAAFMAPLAFDSVERFELPNLKALNFLLRGALRRNLRTDAQGKALGQMLLEMPLPADVARELLASQCDKGASNA